MVLFNHYITLVMVRDGAIALGLLLLKYGILKYAVGKLINDFEGWVAGYFQRHPRHLAFFKHYQDNHQTKNPRQCSEGWCPLIPS